LKKSRDAPSRAKRTRSGFDATGHLGADVVGDALTCPSTRRSLAERLSRRMDQSPEIATMSKDRHSRITKDD
jgi:hypothetical protein